MDIHISVPDDVVEDAIAGLEHYAREIDGYEAMGNEEKLVALVSRAVEVGAYNTRRTRAELEATRAVKMPKVSGRTENPGRA